MKKTAKKSGKTNKEMYDKYFKNRLVIYNERNKVWKILTSFLQKEVPKNGVTLDIGAGYCNFINNIVSKEKHAVDTFKDIHKYVHKGIFVHKQSCVEMENLLSNHFDVVFASNLFEHLTREDLTKTLKHILRILKKGGKLIIIQPNFKYAYKEYFDDYTHLSIYTDISLSDVLLNNGFSVSTCVPKFLPFSMRSKLRELYFLMKLYLYLPYKPFAKQMLIIAKKE